MTVGAVIDGRFRLEALAGSGGMGAVYRARDDETGATVALKLLHPHAFPEAPRLAREAQALAALEHPNIVRYVAHGSLDVGLPYLATEWLEGEDLHARLERGPLPIADTIALGIAVAGALHAAHRVGLVHRDIKPANLLLCGGDPRTVKVLDFGIVRWHGRVITASSAAFGTPGYMAPEQARSAGSVDARADVFSLGCVLFEAASGVPVFAGEDIIAVLTKVMMERRRRCPSAASVPASCRPDPASSSSRRPPVLASLPSGTTLTSSARSSTCDVRVSTSQTTS